MISKKKEEFEKEKKMKKKNENDINNNGETQEDKKTESSSNHNSNNIKEEYVNNVNIKKLDRNKTMVIKHMKTLEKKNEIIKDEDKNDETKITKKRSFFKNVGHSLKIGIKGVFKKAISKEKKNK